MSATDADDNAWTFTIVSITDPGSSAAAGAFTISGTALQAVNPGTLTPGTYTVRVQADDNGSNGPTKKIFPLPSLTR